MTALYARYVVPGGIGIHPEHIPLTARELRDWKGRIEIGRFIVRPDEDGWTIYMRAVVGTLGAIDTLAMVEEFTLLREAFAKAKKLARAEARKAGAS